MGQACRMPVVRAGYLLYLQHESGWSDARRADKWSKMWANGDALTDFLDTGGVPEFL
jgi:hypothetical protein